MREYNLTKPERRNFCACSVFQGILRRQGFELKQDYIASQLTQEEKGYAIHDSKAGSLFRKNGLIYIPYWYDEILFGEPEILIEENFEKSDIVIAYNSHANLLTAIERGLITLLDPTTLSTRTESLDKVFSRMFDDKEGVIGFVSKP